MSAPIGPGDYVECYRGTDRGIDAASGTGGVIVGGVYCVREVIRGRYADGAIGEGLRFVGIQAFDANGREGGWPTEMFRPVYRPNQELIRSLLKPERVDA